METTTTSMTFTPDKAALPAATVLGAVTGRGHGSAGAFATDDVTGIRTWSPPV